MIIGWGKTIRIGDIDYKVVGEGWNKTTGDHWNLIKINSCKCNEDAPNLVMISKKKVNGKYVLWSASGHGLIPEDMLAVRKE